MKTILAGLKPWITTVLFALLIAPAFISYKPSLVRWDDADYLLRSTLVSRAFWSADLPGMLRGMVSSRPPAMTLLGIPFGPIQNWAATGNCYVVLALAIACTIALCFYLLLRIGVHPVAMLLSALCVLLSIGIQYRPYALTPATATIDPAVPYGIATGMLADGWFAWACLGFLLLLPFEVRCKQAGTTWNCILHGILWGALTTLALHIKLNFAFFLFLMLPLLAWIVIRREGARRARIVFLAYLCTSAPLLIFLLLFGRSAVKTLLVWSYGSVARVFAMPLGKFLSLSFYYAPGMAGVLLLVAVALGFYYVLNPRRIFSSDTAALVLVLLFGAAVLFAASKQIRYAFPVIVALPFLASVVVAGDAKPWPHGKALAAAGLLCLLLAVAAVPERSRSDVRSVERANLVLDQATAQHAAHLVLATDSPTLNGALFELARLFRSELPGQRPEVRNLAYSHIEGRAQEKDFADLDQADLVVFQDQPALLPQFSNVRVEIYRKHVLAQGFQPSRWGNDLTLYQRPATLQGR